MCKNSSKPTKCRKEGIVYHILCNQCQAVYVGESSRNGNSRGKEHINNFINKRECSVMLRHNKTHHPNCDQNNPNFTMTVKQIYESRSIDRQISEAIQINNVPHLELINNRQEYQQTKLPRAELTYE